MASDETVKEVVAYKIKRQLAKKALRDIQHQVEEIEQQTRNENRARFVLLIILLAGALTMLLLIRWPDLLQYLSANIDAA